MIYDVDYFISKFEAIPENKWLVREYNDGRGNACVMGHCHIGHSNSDVRNGLQKLFSENSALFTPLTYCLSRYSIYVPEQIINNGDDPKYQQPTPKQRILAALYDIKKMLSKGQEVQECDATKMSKDVEAGTKIIHHYHKVTVPESIETKDLILS